jgi:hypothetical protein
VQPGRATELAATKAVGGTYAALAVEVVSGPLELRVISSTDKPFVSAKERATNATAPGRGRKQSRGRKQMSTN